MRIAGLIFFNLMFVAAAAHSDSEWILPSNCSGPDMSISVRFDGSEVFQSHGPACADYSNNRDGRWKTSLLHVSFQPGQAITWSGYREESFDSPADATLIVDLWLAGVDTTEGVWFVGVTVRGEKAIYMNTIHIADLSGESDSCIAEQFCIRTSVK